MDVQTSGMLPAHAFPILLVFFLQQHGPGPILPCIHDQLKDKGGEVYESKIQTDKIIIIWCNLEFRRVLVFRHDY